MPPPSTFFSILRRSAAILCGIPLSSFFFTFLSLSLFLSVSVCSFFYVANHLVFMRFVLWLCRKSNCQSAFRPFQSVSIRIRIFCYIENRMRRRRNKGKASIQVPSKKKLLYSSLVSRYICALSNYHSQNEFRLHFTSNFNIKLKNSNIWQQF